MFAKKDIIVSSTMGLVVVKDITKLSPDRSAPVTYYVLRSYFDKEKIAYIPVENHEVELREVLSEEEIRTKLEGIKFDEEMPPMDSYEGQILGEASYVLETTPEKLFEQLKKDNTEE